MNETRRTRMTLLQRIKDSQDESAWREFVTIYRNYIYVIVRNMGISHHDAEEIVQSVFARVCDKIPHFTYLPHKGRFRNWLCSITRNMVIDFLRARHSEKTAMDEMVEGNASGRLLDESVVPDVEVMADKEWRNYLANLALEHARKEFSPLMIDCFINHVREKPPAEIAKKLGVAENTVYVYCKRVKEFVKRKVAVLERELE